MIQLKKLSGVLKIVGTVFWWIATVSIIALICVIMGAKIKGRVPYLFGYSVMNIVSGSMEDKIPAGTYILIKKTDASDIQKGDIICFYSDDPNIKGYPNTHTVVEDPIYGENGIEFVTKGEANLLKDDYTAKGDKLIGKYVKNLDGLTRFSQSLQGNAIFFCYMILMGMCVTFMIVPVFIKVLSKDSDGENTEDQQT
jgi:signal peptidase I